jgi:hypothetical protein
MPEKRNISISNVFRLKPACPGHCQLTGWCGQVMDILCHLLSKAEGECRHPLIGYFFKQFLISVATTCTFSSNISNESFFYLHTYKYMYKARRIPPTSTYFPMVWSVDWAEESTKIYQLASVFAVISLENFANNFGSNPSILLA